MLMSLKRLKRGKQLMRSLSSLGQQTYTLYFSALLAYSYSMKSLLKEHMESTKKEDKGMSELEEKYKIYKEKYVRNIIFDLNTTGLSMSFSRYNPLHPLASDPDLL